MLSLSSTHGVMGTPFLYERGGAGLNNCEFVSTRDLAVDFSGPFRWMMEMSMLGVGVGFDTRGAGRLSLVRPRQGGDVHVIDDSREGWAAAVGGQGVAIDRRADRLVALTSENTGIMNVSAEVFRP